jgi:hypothetical protein
MNSAHDVNLTFCREGDNSAGGNSVSDIIEHLITKNSVPFPPLNFHDINNPFRKNKEAVEESHLRDS